MVALNRQNDPLLTQLVDKYLVRDWIKEKIGEEFLVKLLWHGDKPNRIPFDTLPNQCVVKTNHGSGQVIVKDGSIDPDEIVKKVGNWLGENFYYVAREHQYFGVKPRILVEEYLVDGFPDGPLDYRFWCFEGRVKVIQVDDHSHEINPFYDIHWNQLDMRYRKNMRHRVIPRPSQLAAMINIAQKLSLGFDFVRVDLYNINGRILFGEMTFTPVGGQIKFEPRNWDIELGKIWRVDSKYQL